jgi:Carboxypeptidase regulatory-like domain
MPRRNPLPVLFVLIVAGAALATAFAQSATATLSGAVVDEAGAVVAGAKIELTNLSAVLKRAATTSGEGYFSFPLLPPGTYTLQALREGFAPVEIKNIVLNVNDQQAIRIQMKVGQVGATVNVVESATLIRESPAVGTVVDRQFVENLPLNGRSFQSLIQLTPGLVPTATTANRLGQFSVNGQRESTNYFMIDGVSANLGVNTGVSISGSGLGGGAGQYPGYGAQGGTNSLVSVDALQEFRIQTSTFAPEFGRTPGGQVSIVTRSGGNEFHSSLFEYFRNEKLDANDFFANGAGVKRAALRNNQFGGTFSGPLYLPRFGEGGAAYYDGRNRTFFFFSYEGLRLRLPQFRTEQVPSLDARRRASGAVRAFFDAFPVPNGRDLGDGLAEFNASYSDPSTLDATSLRVDHKVGDKLTLFGRYNYSPSESAVRGFSASYITPTRYTIDTRCSPLQENKI